MSRNDGGGLSGRGALAGVVGGEVANVLTITFVVVLLFPEVSSIMKLDMVTWGPGVGGRGSLLPRELKSSKEDTASKSISSCPIRCLTDLIKGETE